HLVGEGGLGRFHPGRKVVILLEPVPREPYLNYLHLRLKKSPLHPSQRMNHRKSVVCNARQQVYFQLPGGNSIRDSALARQMILAAIGGVRLRHGTSLPDLAWREQGELTGQGLLSVTYYRSATM